MQAIRASACGLYTEQAVKSNICGMHLEEMSDQDLITVVIPNYNGMQYLGACLDSILAGSLIPRIIVVDNASKDGSRELVEEQYPMVTMLKLEVNTGFCHAVNAGIHITQTPYVMLLNNDTRVEPDCMERLLFAMENGRRLFSVQALMLSMRDPEVVDDAGDLYSALGWGFARAKGKPRSAVQKRRVRRPVHIFAACAGAALYRMDILTLIGGFDERHFCYLEDIDIGWRAQIAGYGNRMAPDAVVYHAGSATTGSRYNAFKEIMTAGNNAYLLYKNMPFVQYWLNSPLWALGRLIKTIYFDRMGLGDAYAQGLDRGRYLKAEDKTARRLARSWLPYRKGSLSDEACVEAKKPVTAGEGKPEEARAEASEEERKAAAEENVSYKGITVEDRERTLDDVIPLYIGGKVPFAFRAIPRYVSIEGQLIAGCFRRLCN